MKTYPATRGRAALLSALLVLLLSCAVVLPAAARIPREEKGKLSTLLDRTAHQAGGSARLAAVLEIEDGWHVNAHEPSFDYLIPTALTVTLPDGWGAASVVYPQAVSRTFAFAEQPLAVYQGRVVMLAALPVPAGTADGRYPVAAAVTYQACDDDSCLPPVTTRASTELVVGAGGTAQHEALFAAGPVQGHEAARDTGGAAAAATGTGGGRGGDPSAGLGAGRFALMLLFGFVGGVILNVMPCVLPVLSLKVFGLVKSAGIGRREVVVGSLATTAGILASFWALALFAIAPAPPVPPSAGGCSSSSRRSSPSWPSWWCSSASTCGGCSRSSSRSPSPTASAAGRARASPATSPPASSPP